MDETSAATPEPQSAEVPAFLIPKPPDEPPSFAHPAWGVHDFARSAAHGAWRTHLPTL